MLKLGSFQAEYSSRQPMRMVRSGVQTGFAPPLPPLPGPVRLILGHSAALAPCSASACRTLFWRSTVPALTRIRRPDPQPLTGAAGLGEDPFRSSFPPPEDGSSYSPSRFLVGVLSDSRVTATQDLTPDSSRETSLASTKRNFRLVPLPFFRTIIRQTLPFLVMEEKLRISIWKAR